MIYDWSGKKLLIVEDNDINCLLFEHILNNTKLDFIFAISSNDFFDLVDNNTYDLILMDINICEDITGIDLIKYLKYNNIKTPVIIHSALDSYNLDNPDIKGIDVIRKPMDINLFMVKLNNVFK